MNTTVLRSVVALVGGYAIMAFLLFGLTVGAALLFPALFHVGLGAPNPAFVCVNLSIAAAAAAVGGYSTAALAPDRPRTHLGWLAIMILAMALSSLGTPPRGEPAWYPVALAIAAPLAALLGGSLRRPRTVLPATA